MEKEYIISEHGGSILSLYQLGDQEFGVLCEFRVFRVIFVFRFEFTENIRKDAVGSGEESTFYAILLFFHQGFRIGLGVFKDFFSFEYLSDLITDLGNGLIKSLFLFYDLIDHIAALFLVLFVRAQEEGIARGVLFSEFEHFFHLLER